MTDLATIKQAVLENITATGGDWQTYFQRAGSGYACILFDDLRLSPGEYVELASRFTGSLSATELKRNALRHRVSHGH